MKLSGMSGLCNSFDRQVFPAFRKNGGSSSFLDEMKKTGEAATAEKIRDSVEKSQYDAQLKLVYDRLSTSSKNVLERLKTEENDIKKDEWMDLCRELKDAGVLTQSDFDYTRADGHLIPIGYYNANGTFVQYDTPPMLAEKLHTLSGMPQSSAAGNSEAWLSGSGWTGDPLEYLDAWVSALYDWRSDMARERAADGSPKFEDFSPINTQISSCQKVSHIIKELTKF